MKQFFIAIDRGLCRVQSFLCAIGMVLAVLIIVANGILRAFFGIGLIWGEETVRYIMILTVCLGASLAIRHNVHVKVDVIQIMLPFKLEKALIVFTYFLGLIFCIYFGYAAFHNTVLIQSHGQQSPTMTWFPMWVINVPLVLFGILGAKDFTQLIVMSFVKKGEIVRTIDWNPPPIKVNLDFGDLDETVQKEESKGEGGEAK